MSKKTSAISFSVMATRKNGKTTEERVKQIWNVQRKIRQGCGFTWNMPRFLDGFVYYGILLVRQDNRLLF